MLEDENLKRSVSIMLSYGDGNNITPVGTFYLKDVVSDSVSCDLLFEKIEYKNNKFITDQNSTVTIPAQKFIDLLVTKGCKNSSALRSMLGHGTDVTPGLISLLEDSLEETEKEINNAKYEALSMSLEELDARYYTNNEERNSNYSVVPFSLGRVLEKVLVKTYHEEENTKGRSR